MESTDYNLFQECKNGGNGTKRQLRSERVLGDDGGALKLMTRYQIDSSPSVFLSLANFYPQSILCSPSYYPSDYHTTGGASKFSSTFPLESTNIAFGLAASLQLLQCAICFPASSGAIVLRAVRKASNFKSER